MISDPSSLIAGGPQLVPCGTKLDTCFNQAVAQAYVQPVVDVVAYIASRRPQPHYQGEEGLLITLPNKKGDSLQEETKARVRAVHHVHRMVTGPNKIKVQPACEAVIKTFNATGRNWNLKTFRALYDEWADKQDWLVLVNRAKAPAAWREGNAGLPDAFLKACEQRFGGFNRADNKRQALLSIKRQWVTGKTEKGIAQPIPGYEAGWDKRDRNHFPGGWHYTNICRQIKARGKYTKAVQALLNDSESAARQVLPQVLGTRQGLRFLEKITFDDLRLDYLAFNPLTGQAEEIWVLVARDEATAMVLGFVLHFSTVREDGTASHLGAREMKELCAYLLERYPLPPYTMHWVVERGTATLAEAVKDALAELFNDRIKVHYTSMIGNRSPVGYKEKAKGNSRGKASHEAHNRLFHTQGSWVEGQTGAHYGIRPADLAARVKECQEINQLRQSLPEDRRAEVQFPLKLTSEIRGLFEGFCRDQNFRTDHNLQDFEKVLEWCDPSTGQMRLGGNAPAGVPVKPRMESPVERALRLIQAVDRWDRVDPNIIRTFLEHTERREIVEPNGEIKMTLDGKVLWFKSASGAATLVPGTKVLAYHHSEDPRFLHLTDGKGCFLGTWVQRGRVAYQDEAALADALRHTHSARQTAMDTATELAAPQIAALAEMRERNAALAQFVVTANIPEATGCYPHGAPGENTVAGTLSTVASNVRAAQRAEAKRQANLAAFEGEASDLVDEPPRAPQAPCPALAEDDFGAESLL